VPKKELQILNQIALAQQENMKKKVLVIHVMYNVRLVKALQITVPNVLETEKKNQLVDVLMELTKHMKKIVQTVTSFV
jgi:Tfp pilus assembly major pilin PilA